MESCGEEEGDDADGGEGVGGWGEGVGGWGEGEGGDGGVDLIKIIAGTPRKTGVWVGVEEMDILLGEMLQNY